jgi:hypothetical protein
VHARLIAGNPLFLLQLDERLACIRWITLDIGFRPKGSSSPTHHAFPKSKLSAASNYLHVIFGLVIMFRLRRIDSRSAAAPGS